MFGALLERRISRVGGVQQLMLLKYASVEPDVAGMQHRAEVPFEEDHGCSRTMVCVQEGDCRRQLSLLVQQYFSWLVHFYAFDDVDQLGELEEEQRSGDGRAIYGAEVPAIRQAVKVVGVHMSQEEHVVTEGFGPCGGKLVHQDVGKLNQDHPSNIL